jgi:ABC-type multidrug transport system ATPase subunit
MIGRLLYRSCISLFILQYCYDCFVLNKKERVVKIFTFCLKKNNQSKRDKMENKKFGLSIRNVSKTYANGVRALHNLTLDIPNGMYGLLGPNGAGKSTLMRILATLQDPDSGTIHLDNLNVLDQKDEVRKTLGYLPQEFGVYPKVSAENLLDHFAILKGITKKGERKDVVEALLRQTNLWDVRRQKLGGYSGGMRQRFGVAIALLGNPKLMIVDEPTAGLDPAERVRFLNLLSELGESSAVILSTHIVEDVSELCTRMAIIRKGQILLEAEPMVAVNELQGKIWRRMIDKSALKEIEQQHAVISTKLLAGRTVVHIYSEQDPGNDFDKVEADLEDVYFSTMAGHYGKGCIKQQEVNA